VAAVVEVAVGRAEGLETSLASPLFWQYLLAAELPYDKSREVVSTLGTSLSDPLSALLSYRRLTDGERRKLDRVNTKALERALAAGITVVEPSQYGGALARSDSPPVALFAWGDTSVLRKPTIAIVGTRSATPYGRACAQKFAEAFAQAGLVVVSGGAMGIDESAHTGAMEAGGETIAVFANGVDIVQPPKNGPLFERIRSQGCLVSPFAVGTPAMEFRFRPRNELIAAMSMAVLLVEAPASSGALMTCTAAADLGREVFVVPGTIDRPTFRGSHNLIRDGATLVDDPAQVLASLGIEPASVSKRAVAGSEIQQSILAALTVDPQAPEKIVSGLGLESGKVMAELTLMELDGLIIKTGTGYAIKP
jgi:DNA processing protein